MKKRMALFLSLMMALPIFVSPVKALETNDNKLHDNETTLISKSNESTKLDSYAETNKLKITSIVADSRVAANDREVYAFTITVNDASLIKGLKAEDFDIKGNISSSLVDMETGQPWNVETNCYKDDGIELSIKDNVITMKVKQFAYSNAWEVECKTIPELTFTSKKVTQLNTDTLDNAIIGKFTYAGITRDYALYLPDDVDGPVPLVIWNHGGGEYAIDIETNLIKNRGLTAWPEAGYKTAVLMIQVSNQNYSYGTAFSPEKQELIDRNNALQAALVKNLIKKGIVDENRVYVTGASSGGGATMRFLMQYPELFAGAIVCCSMDPIVWVHFNKQDSYETIVSNFEKAFQDKVYTWDEEKGKMVEKKVDTQVLTDVPIYFTHAQNDPTCNVNSSKAMYEALANLGDTNNQIVIWSDEDMAEDGISNSFPSKDYPALLHWSWVRVFNHNEEGTPMNWLFKQVKKEPVDKEPEEPVDKEPLEKLVSTAKEIDVSNLTAESKKLYTDAVAAAEKVLNNENATAEDVQNVYKKLSTVLDNLKEKTVNNSEPKVDVKKPTVNKEEKTSSKVKTSDMMTIAPYAIIALLSGAILVSLKLKKKESE